MGSREKDTDSLIMYDRTFTVADLRPSAAIGFIMVTSASMPIGQRFNQRSVLLREA